MIIGTISGHVYQADGRTPIAVIRVFANDYQTGERIYGTATRPDGGYILPLPSGSYTVTVCATCSGLPKFADQLYPGTPNKQDAIPVSVTAPGNTPGIDFTLESESTISGHVYQADGRTPIVGIYVFAENEKGKRIDNTVTSQDGSYTMALPTGSYRVQACPSCSNTAGFVREWHGGTIVKQDAILVPVSGNNDISNIDFSLEVGGTISGYVYEADGRTPIVRAKVHARGNDWTIYVYTQQDGRYSISVPSGAYKLYVKPVYAKLPMYVEDRWFDGGLKQGRQEDATPVFVTAPGDASRRHSARREWPRQPVPRPNARSGRPCEMRQMDPYSRLANENL